MEDVEVIEIHEAPEMDVPLPVAHVDKPTVEMSLAETPVSEVTSPTEVTVIEHVATAEPVSTETPQGEAAKFNISTSVSTGKNHNFLDLVCVSLYSLLNPKVFYRGSHGSYSSNDVRARTRGGSNSISD